MKTAIYCRVSTDDQEKEGTSLQTQREACLRYCQEKGYEVAKQFTETYSGLTLERPQMVKLRDLIRANSIDVLVVYCLDRLSRNATHGVILRDELDKHHVLLESVTEDIDKSPLGEAITYLRGTFAQIEAEKIRERTMRGKQARMKEGKLPHGTGIGIYGYDWNKETGHRTINELESRVVQRIFSMVLKGASFHRIAIELNKAGIKSKSGSLWNPLTIRRIATNETYTGRTYSGKTRRIDRTKVVYRPQEEWVLLPDVTPQTIDDETFKRAQEAISQAKQSRPVKANAAYLLTGFIKCPKCGSPIGGTTLNGKYRYYKCRGSNPTATRGKICDAGYIKAGPLEESVWSKVLEMLSNPLTLLRTLTHENHQDPNAIVAQLNKQITSLRKKLKAYPRKEKSLYELLQHDAVTKDYVLDAVNKLKQEWADDANQLEAMLAQRKEVTQASHLSLKLSDIAFNKWSDLDYRYEWDYELWNTIPGSDEPPFVAPHEISVQLARKRSLLEAIRLKVTADPNGYQFSFTLDGQIISTTDAGELSSFEDELRKFESQHPEVSVKDLLDAKKQLPGNTPFVQKVNKLKQNLVTIEQTWA